MCKTRKHSLPETNFKNSNTSQFGVLTSLETNSIQSKRIALLQPSEDLGACQLLHDIFYNPR